MKIVSFLSGHKDHIHLHIEYPPKISVNEIIKMKELSPIAERISTFRKVILGAAFVGHEIWSVEQWKYK